ARSLAAPAGLRLTRDQGLALLAVMGWFSTLALAVVLLRQNQQWRTTFRTREWFLVPSHEGQALLNAAQNIIVALQQNERAVEQALLALAAATTRNGEAVDKTRNEFSILREELEQKRTALETARLGAEFRY